MNVLFVFSDQQRHSSLGAYGNQVVQTPNLDRMAAEGMVCESMFSNHPLCSPFRAILLTGRYGWRNGVIDNEYEPFRDIPTLPGELKSAGYHTGHIGVWHLGVPPYPEQDRYGLDYLAAVAGVGGNYFDQRYHENETGPTLHEGWSPVVETDLAIRFMERHLEERASDPFALFVSWRPPHWPYPQYPEEYGGYDPAEIDLPGNVPPQMADFARREIADYYGCCTGLDAQMGRLLAALDRLGLSGDTLVCYSSDHGDHLSSHGYGK
ncbi:MAG: sulfatase-like hydrolase/transferase, partial [Gammaproteobacteria bacterium]|nr:sulfatase-like hydrolase/transferase [Gammaproteobacteria bacterium]